MAKHKVHVADDPKFYAFHPKVFAPPYAPYYDAYKGHTFRIVSRPAGFAGHVSLVCTDDPSVIVNGYVHDDEILPAGSPLLDTKE